MHVFRAIRLAGFEGSLRNGTVPAGGIRATKAFPSATDFAQTMGSLKFRSVVFVAGGEIRRIAAAESSSVFLFRSRLESLEWQQQQQQQQQQLKGSTVH